MKSVIEEVMIDRSLNHDNQSFQFVIEPLHGASKGQARLQDVHGKTEPTLVSIDPRTLVIRTTGGHHFQHITSDSGVLYTSMRLRNRTFSSSHCDVCWEDEFGSV